MRIVLGTGVLIYFALVVWALYHEIRREIKKRRERLGG
jgi:hypothetical protein